MKKLAFALSVILITTFAQHSYANKNLKLVSNNLIEDVVSSGTVLEAGTCNCTRSDGTSYIVPSATKSDCDGLIRMGRNCSWTPASTPSTPKSNLSNGLHQPIAVD
ncbi:MAG: hypothetical protein LW823_10080 [Rickettsiales bacterium]|jgi:hypothetical protein|nr:hypothetical protein [Rickettsiales bacterium]